MNLGLKLQHNMTSCQGLVPADFKPNHLGKWILPLHKRGILLSCFYSSLHCRPPHFHLPSFPIERGDLGLAALLMRSCFAWLVITEWFSPLLDEDVICFWTQMGFSHWHEPGPGTVRGPLTSHLSIYVVMYNYPSIFVGQIHLWDKKGRRGDEKVNGEEL